MATQMTATEHSEGWITFAAILAGVAGVANGVWGLAAVLNTSALAQYSVLFTKLNAWGWAIMLFGIVQIIAAFMLVARSNAGRILAIVLAAVSILGWMMWLGALPFAGLAALVLDVLVIYGLSVTGPYFGTQETYETRPTSTAPTGGMPVGSH